MISIVAPIMLAIVLTMADGITYQRNIEYKSLEACWTAAHQFMQSRPSDFGAIAMGAGCVVYPGLRPS